MAMLIRRALARALFLAAASCAAPASAQSGLPTPVTPAVSTVCPAFAAFPMTLNLGSTLLLGLDGVTSRCAFSQVQAALNTRGLPNGLAPLDGNGLVPQAMIPAISLSNGTLSKLTITGAGSTGDVSGMSVMPSTGAAAGTLANTIATQSGSISTNAGNVAANTAAISSEVSRAQASEGLLAPKSSPTFTGTITSPAMTITGIGSTGDVSGMSVTPSSSAAANSLANILYAPSFGGQVSAANIVTSAKTGIRAILPSAPDAYGINVNISPSGAPGNNYFPNQIYAATDTADAGSGFINMLTAADFFGGASAGGGRQAIQGQVYLTAPTKAGNPQRNYTAVDGHAAAQTGDGGTNLTTDARGAMFGLSGEGILCGTAVTSDCTKGVAATNFLNVTGAELNVGAFAGSSVKIKTGAQIVALSGDAVQGSLIDAALSFSNQSPSAGFQNLIEIHDQNGTWPLTSTGCILCTYSGSAQTISKGIDLSPVTITGNALSFKYASLAGNSGTLYLGTSATGNTPSLNFQSGGSGAQVDSQIIATGGGASNLLGTINYKAGNHQFTGNIGFNGAAPVGKCTLPATLATDGSANSATLATAINGYRTCLTSNGLGQ